VAHSARRSAFPPPSGATRGTAASSRAAVSPRGLAGWRNEFDENLLNALATSCVSPSISFTSKKLLVLDARSYAGPPSPTEQVAAAANAPSTTPAVRSSSWDSQHSQHPQSFQSITGPLGIAAETFFRSE